MFETCLLYLKYKEFHLQLYRTHVIQKRCCKDYLAPYLRKKKRETGCMHPLLYPIFDDILPGTMANGSVKIWELPLLKYNMDLFYNLFNKGTLSLECKKLI